MSPFLGDNDMETVNNIASGEFEYPDPDPEEGYEDISDLAKKFIESLLVKSSRWVGQVGGARLDFPRTKSGWKDELKDV